MFKSLSLILLSYTIDKRTLFKHRYASVLMTNPVYWITGVPPTIKSEPTEKMQIKVASTSAFVTVNQSCEPE
jgi:hypothetical protein